MNKNPTFALLPKPRQEQMLTDALAYVQGSSAGAEPGQQPTYPAGMPPGGKYVNGKWATTEGAEIVNDPKHGWVGVKDGKMYELKAPAGIAGPSNVAPVNRPAAPNPATALPTSVPAPRQALPTSTAATIGPEEPEATPTPQAALDNARAARSAAEKALRTYGAPRIRSDPAGYAKAKADFAVAQKAEADAKQALDASKAEEQRAYEAGLPAGAGAAALPYRGYADGGAIGGDARVAQIDKRIRDAKARRDTAAVARLTRDRESHIAARRNA